MSSGIPSLPAAKAAKAQDNDNEDYDILQHQGGDDSDAESGADDALSNNVDSDNDDASSTGNSTSNTDDTDDDETENEAEDDTRAPGGGDGDGDSSADEDAGAAARAAGTSGVNAKKKSAASSSSRRKKNVEDDMTMLGVPHGLHFDDDEPGDDDGDDSDDEDRDSSEYFQKLKLNVRESYVETYHPESMSHNYDEIQTLARVVRNSAGVIVDDLHRTIPIMTKYEKTRILGQRARQINEGAPAFIKIDSTVIDGYLIAVKELEQKKTPFIIRRPLPNGGSEYWRVQDLEIL